MTQQTGHTHTRALKLYAPRGTSCAAASDRQPTAESGAPTFRSKFSEWSSATVHNALLTFPGAQNFLKKHSGCNKGVHHAGLLCCQFTRAADEGCRRPGAQTLAAPAGQQQGHLGQAPKPPKQLLRCRSQPSSFKLPNVLCQGCGNVAGHRRRHAETLLCTRLNVMLLRGDMPSSVRVNRNPEGMQE